MSIDRRIDLNTSVAQDLGDLAQPDSGLRREASDADRRAFERALAQPDDEGADDAGPSAQRQADDAAARPFGLFGAAPVMAASPASSSVALAGLARDLACAADRLLVGDGSGGRREVRIALADDVLPGVTVSVFEDAGRVVAAFACASEASREKLCVNAAALAAELAASLRRPCLVRVTTDDLEDPCLFEAEAGDPYAAPSVAAPTPSDSAP
ncbi:hypothetical protein [Bordetella genomosp. 13]|uniref:hypothetical protein n=1 Tax=Bordetella genomosp. 13 TaxID=463040 RepID=UPI0011A46659|nr:hypothetical protein [Bordetella genomosp. 13]